jgi:hypothetical protein
MLSTDTIYVNPKSSWKRKDPKQYVGACGVEQFWDYIESFMESTGKSIRVSEFLELDTCYDCLQTALNAWKSFGMITFVPDQLVQAKVDELFPVEQTLVTAG